MAEGAAMSADHPWLRAYPAAIDWHASLPARPLADLLDDSVRRFADRPCIDFLGRRYSYADVGALVDRFARGLAGLGIGKGARVGLFLPNTPYFVIAYFGALKAGATVVNFNPLYADREIAHQIEDSGTEIMVTLDLEALYGKLKGFLGTTALKRLVICPMAGALPALKALGFRLLKRSALARDIPDDGAHVRFDRLIANDGRPDPVAIDPVRDVALLQYTGGTTGTPKGAMLTHANLFANAAQSAAWFHGHRPGAERMLGVLPLFHVFAMTVVMNLGLFIGAELVLLPRFELTQVMATIARRRITLFPAVPTIYAAINNHERVGSYDLSSIRFCISGGAPLPAEVKAGFEGRTGCKLVEGYGLTEAAPVVTCNPIDGVNKPGSVGLPLPGTRILIMSRDAPGRPAPIGERGEICVIGPQVMAGYWGHPDETAQVLADGMLHTGDIGTMDADGYVFIVDRIKDLILCGGYNVYPRVVEDAIYQHPAVAQCVVAGLPDSYRGQTVKAYVALAPGASLSEADLIGFLRDKLSPIEMPKQVEFRAELPRTMIGKLSRKTLLEEEASTSGGTTTG